MIFKVEFIVWEQAIAELSRIPMSSGGGSFTSYEEAKRFKIELCKAAMLLNISQIEVKIEVEDSDDQKEETKT